MTYSLRDYLVAALFFGAVISIFAINVGSFAVEYNSTSIVDDDFTEKYSEFDEYASRVESAKDSLSSEGGLQVLDIGFGIFEASFAFINLVLSSFGLISTPLESFTEDFNLPFQIAGIIFTLLSTVLVVTLITRIYSSVTQGRF
jgi:hypothetical protein